MVEGLDAQTLLGLLQMYETALAELETTRDPGVAGLILRFERHRADVIEALAARSPVLTQLGGGHQGLRERPT